MRRAASVVVVAAWLTALLGTTIVAAGMGPIGDATQLVPADLAAATAALRGLMGAAAGWLLVASVIEVARAAGAQLRIVGPSPLPGMVRRALAGLVAGGLAVPAVVAVPMPSFQRLAVDALARVDQGAPPSSSGETATLIGVVPDHATEEDPAPADHVPSAQHETESELPEWVVEPGQHVWGIAVNHLSGVWGRPPTDGEVAVHMAATIEANADRFVVPNNPDLIRPGQRLLLPPPPASRSREVQ